MFDTDLNETLTAYSTVLSDVGLAVPRRHRRDEQATAAVAAVQEAIDPLVLPTDLEDLWRQWKLDSFIHLAHQQSELLTPGQALEQWPIEAPAPRMLMPFLDERPGVLAVELGATDFPGGRIFELTPRAEPRAISSTLSALFSAWTATLQSRRFSGVAPGEPAFWEVAMMDRSIRADVVDQAGAMFRRPSTWPEPWRDAAGLSAEDLAPRGATETVAHFDKARREQAPVTATLTGTYELFIAGGTLGGAVGVLTDVTGSIQLYIPDSVDEFGGPVGPVEVDVIGNAPSGVSASDEGIEPPVGTDADDYAAYMIALIELMKTLDRSVTATAIRPASPQ